jgi:hypothetical protein
MSNHAEQRGRANGLTARRWGDLDQATASEELDRLSTWVD